MRVGWEIIPGLIQRGLFHEWPMQRKLALLDKERVGIVVNLTRVRDEELESWMLGNGLEYVFSPIADGRSFDSEALQKTAGRVVAHMRAGRGAMVHCRAGRNRSGFISALVAMEMLGISGAQAVELVQKRRPLSLYNEYFVSYLQSLPAPKKEFPLKLTYVIGEPGAGKSALLAELTSGVPWYARQRPFAMSVMETPAGNVHELGERRAGFPGTDTLSMSVQPRVLDWLQLEQPALVVGEGDRLATESFFMGATALGYEVTVVLLSVPVSQLEARRAQRVRVLSRKPQNAAWMAGRATKVKRLAESWASYTLDGSKSTLEIATEAASLPVLAELTARREAC